MREAFIYTYVCIYEHTYIHKQNYTKLILSDQYLLLNFLKIKFSPVGEYAGRKPLCK